MPTALARLEAAFWLLFKKSFEALKVTVFLAIFRSLSLA